MTTLPGELGLHIARGAAALVLFVLALIFALYSWKWTQGAESAHGSFATVLVAGLPFFLISAFGFMTLKLYRIGAGALGLSALCFVVLLIYGQIFKPDSPEQEIPAITHTLTSTDNLKHETPGDQWPVWNAG